MKILITILALGILTGIIPIILIILISKNIICMILLGIITFGLITKEICM